MHNTLDKFLPMLFRHEGGYVDHPRDPGGATNMGITIRTLGVWLGRPASKKDVRELTRETAAAIYRAEYWDRIKADALAAGPDAALFDVAVNSGVGRARAWAGLAAGDPVEAVKAICARRRAFFRSLRTFEVFGKGWMRRVNEVEAWSIRWALNLQGKLSDRVLEAEADKSSDKAGKAGAGATTGAGVVVVTPTHPAAHEASWLTLVVIGLPVALAFGWLIYTHIVNKDRAEVFRALNKGRGNG